MLSIARINPLVRAIGVISAVAVLVTGVTLAFTTNSVALEQSSITVDNEVLQIWDADIPDWNIRADGFAFAAVLGAETAREPFYLKNLTDSNLQLSATLAAEPVPTNVALEDVDVMIYDELETLVLTTTLQALADGDVTFNALHQLDANADGNNTAVDEGNYFISVKVNDLVDSNDPATVPAFDLLFTGTSIVES